MPKIKFISAHCWPLLVLIGALNGCVSRQSTLELPEGAPPEISFERYRSLPPDTRWQVATNQVSIKVYRAGRLARLGHNHIISSSGLVGMVYFDAASSGKDSGAFADLYLPVATFEVDDANLRGVAGEEFASIPSARDIEGTRSNMVSDRVLDARNHPYIVLELRQLNAQQAALTLHFQGRALRKPIGVKVTTDGAQLRASSRFSLTHSELGLTPFSVLGGAIAVENQMDVELQLTAQRG